MALIGINAVQRNNQPGTLTRIAQGLDIAQKVLGITLAVPEYLQKKDVAKLQEAESKAVIGEKTIPAKEGEPGSFDVPGMGLRTSRPDSLKSLQTANLIGDIQEDARKRQKLTDSQKLAYKGWLQEVGIKNVSDEMLPQTVGEMAEDRRARLSAMQITPQQNREFEYKVGQDIDKSIREKQARYIKDLDQYADTETDAKDIKTSLANKKAIERMVDEMIDLRTKTNGGTVLDREAKARAGSLATQALLKYKNLAQLGVLSKTDIELVDKLVPGDPLEINPSGIAGQDPTMARLQQLKKNLNEDYRIFLESKGLSAPAQEETRTVNGKTYKRVP